MLIGLSTFYMFRGIFLNSTTAQIFTDKINPISSTFQSSYSISIPPQLGSSWNLEGPSVSAQSRHWAPGGGISQRGNFKCNSFPADPAHWRVCSVCASDVFSFCGITVLCGHFFLPRLTSHTRIATSQRWEHLGGGRTIVIQMQFTRFLIWMWVNFFSSSEGGKKKGNRIFWKWKRAVC